MIHFRYEAVELRDGDKGVYLGNGVAKAVKNINEKISEALIGMDPTLQSQIDHAMIDLDKTEKKVFQHLSAGRTRVYLIVKSILCIVMSMLLLCHILRQNWKPSTEKKLDSPSEVKLGSCCFLSCSCSG